MRADRTKPWGYAAFPLFGEDPEPGDRVLFDPPEALGSAVPYLKTVRGVPGMRVAVGPAANRANSLSRSLLYRYAMTGRPVRPGNTDQPA